MTVRAMCADFGNFTPASQSSGEQTFLHDKKNLQVLVFKF